jgi:hypothetical protein
MNLEPLHSAATEMTNLLAWVQQSMPDAAGIWPDMSVDDGTGLLMPALAGIAAAMTIALAVAIYFQTGYRSYRDMICHGLAAAIGLTLMAFVIADMRNVALAYLARLPRRPQANSTCNGRRRPSGQKRSPSRWATRIRAKSPCQATTLSSPAQRRLASQPLIR